MKSLVTLLLCLTVFHSALGQLSGIARIPKNSRVQGAVPPRSRTPSVPEFELSDVKEFVKNDFLNGSGTIEDMLHEEGLDIVRDLDLDDIRNIPDELREMMLLALDGNATDVLCRKASLDPKMIKHLHEAGIDCMEAFKKEGGRGVSLSAGTQRELIEQKRDAKPPGDWDASDLEDILSIAPDAVDADVIRDIAGDAFKDVIRGGSFRPADIKDESQRRAMSKKVEEAFGGVSDWTASDVRDLADSDFLGTMVDASVLRKMDAADIRSSLESLSSVTFDSNAKREAISRKVKEGLGGRDSADQWSPEDVKGAAKYIMKDIGVLEKLDDNTMLDSLQNFTAAISKRREALVMGKRLKKMPAFQDPSALSAGDVEQLGASLPAMGKKFLKELPADAVSSNLDSLGEMDFKPADARGLMDKIKTSVNIATMDAATVKSMGKLMAGLKADDMSDIPSASLDDPEVVTSMGNLDLKPSQARAILKKLRDNNGGRRDLGPNAKSMGKMIKSVAMSELENTDIDNFGLSCEGSDTPNLKPGKAQAVILMKKLKEKYGEINSTNTNYTGDCFSKWGHIAAMGLSASDLDNLRTDDALPVIAEMLADNEAEMGEAQTKAVFNVLKRTLLSSDEDSKSITGSQIEQFGKFLKHMSDDDLDKFNDTVKAVVARKVGEASLKNMPNSEIKRLKAFALKNVDRDAGGISDRTNAASYDDTDITNLGNLKCGMEQSDMAKLTSDAIENNIFEMGKDCVYDSDTGSELLKRAKSEISGLLDSGDNVLMVGGLLGYSTEADRNSITDSTYEEILSDLGEVVEEKLSSMKEREKSFGEERPLADAEAERHSLRSSLKDGLDAITVSSSSGRKKRSVAYTCTDIQLLGDVTVLSADEISAMDTTEFEDCASTFGATGDWDDDQFTALASKATSTYGSPSTWTSDEIQDAGSMVAGLSASDIGTLTLDSDAMSAIGAFDVYSSDQLQQGYSNYLQTIYPSGSSADLTSDDLMSLGAFICGATTADIDAISVSAYRDAASSVGEQTMFEPSQLASLAIMAQNSQGFGSLPTWDLSAIVTVGFVIGGLSSDQIGTLTEAQINAIAPDVMALIPPTKFSGFTATQIGYFTSSQVAAVTNEQAAALSAEAQEALELAGGVTVDGNGAGTLAFSLTGIMTGLVLIIVQ